MSLLTLFSLIVYAAWRSMNIYQSFIHSKRFTPSKAWEILFSFLMCYWLVMPSVMFLFAQAISGFFALALGIYLSMMAGPEKFLAQRDKIVNNYWSYAITDAIICVTCFLLSIAGNLNG